MDFEKHQINVCHNVPFGSNEVKQPKWGSSRILPLPPALAVILKHIPDMPDHSPLFVIYNQAHADASVDITTINRALERMLKRIGIDAETKRARHLSVHSLRHTFITLSRLGGLPDFLVQRLAGHKSAQMMERYSHVKNIIDYDAAQAKFQKFIDDAGEDNQEHQEKCRVEGA